MIYTSEFVAPGHPDKVADIIVSYILDRYLERDRNVRFALECQIKDNFVTLGGEVTSTFKPTDEDLKGFVREAVCLIGYTPEYYKKWGEGNCIDPDALDVTIHIGMQSPDIAQGVDQEGWGDQGIMWGMAVYSPETDYMPLDHYIAKMLGMHLYTLSRDGVADFGLDIKTQVTVDDGKVTEVVVAAPVKTTDALRRLHGEVEAFLVKEFCVYPGTYELTVNGTGAYVRHASQGDCGTTGRKLAVDFYGGNCRIGGGCPWGKDPSKADVTLNIYARELAKNWVEQSGGISKTIYCAINCCIGQKKIGIVYFDGHLRQVCISMEDRPASKVIEEMGLREPVWACKAMNGLFCQSRKGEAVRSF